MMRRQNAVLWLMAAVGLLFGLLLILSPSHSAALQPGTATPSQPLTVNQMTATAVIVGATQPRVVSDIIQSRTPDQTLAPPEIQ